MTDQEIEFEIKISKQQLVRMFKKALFHENKADAESIEQILKTLLVLEKQLNLSV